MSNVKFLYVRNPFQRRDITIASDLIEDKNGPKIKFAWTFRRNDEEFIKKLGRDVAMDRLVNADPQYSAELPVEEVRFYGISKQILEHICNQPTTPKKYLNDLFEDLYYYDYCLQHS